MKKMSFALLLFAAIFMFIACGDDPTPVVVTPDNEPTEDSDVSDADTAEPVDNTPETDADADADVDNPPVDDGCEDGNLGKTCTKDSECGACMICVTGGKCAKGCKSDDDCTMLPGLHCNTKLARCVNIYASSKACSDASCPTGCCYADKGLSGLKCAKEASPATCGLCQNGEVYSPEDSKCLPAACSSTTDNCPTLNAGSTKPEPKCFECKSGELVCSAKTSTSGCSAGTVINAAQCVPAGQQCVEGVSECCSGMPCVQGYCY